jgi:transcriptional regulator with XRE-family HTH domain
MKRSGRYDGGMSTIPDKPSLHDIFVANVEVRFAQLGINGAQMAALIDCTPSYIYQVLSGHRSVGIDTLGKWSRALQTEPHMLIMPGAFGSKSKTA